MRPAGGTVTGREPVPGRWRLLAESQRRPMLGSNVATWRVTVPAAGGAALTHRALIECRLLNI